MTTLRIALTLLSITFCSFAFTQTNQRVQAADLACWNGIYNGTLTYKDYGSGELVTIQTVGAVSNANNKLDIRILISEWGDTYKQHYTYKIKGETFQGYTLMCNVLNEKTGIRTLKMTKTGQDDKRSCIFSLTFEGTSEHWSIQKEVRYKGTDTFILRNEYVFQRVNADDEKVLSMGD